MAHHVLGQKASLVVSQAGGHLPCPTRVLCLNGSVTPRSQGAGGCGFCSQAAAGALSFRGAVFLPSLPSLLCWKHIPKPDGQQQPVFWDSAPVFKVPVAVPRLVQLHAGQVHTLRSHNKPTLIRRAGGTRRYQRPNAPHARSLALGGQRAPHVP